MIEIQSFNEILKTDTLATMVAKQFWVSRKKFSTLNRDRLAKMAGVTTEEYNDAIDKYDGKKDIRNYTYNMLIREKILGNDVLPLTDKTESLKGIDDADELVATFGKEKVQAYFTNMSSEMKSFLKPLSLMQKKGFLESEFAGIEKKKVYIKERMGNTITDATMEQIANLTYLMDMQERLMKFVADHSLDEFKRDEETRKFAYTKTEEEFQAFLKQSKDREGYKKIIEKYGVYGAEEYMRTAYVLQHMEGSTSYAKLSVEEKSELKVILVEFYEQSQTLHIDLSFFDLESLYIKAREFLAERYGGTESYRALMNNINIDSDMTEFFAKEEYSVTEIWPEEGKDKAYYKRLCERYPEFDTTLGDEKTMQDVLEYFDEDMNVRSDISAKEKKYAESMLKRLPTYAKPYEERLVKKTNGVVQEFAVSKCIESLQNYMDIDISEEENLMEQLQILSDTDAVSSANGELLLKIQGVRNGKRMTLSYDLLSGNVYYHPYLYKPSKTEGGALTVGEKNDHNKIPLTTLPSISKIMDGAKDDAKDGEYQWLIRTSKDLDAYIENIKDGMESKDMFGEGIAYELSQDMLKKQVIQDEIVQNMVACTGRVMGEQEDITKQYAHIHGLYSLLYRTMEYYSMQSVDKLISLNDDIKELLRYRKEKSTRSVLDIKDIENQEMFVLQALVNIKTIPQSTKGFAKQWPEENMALFFKCFEKNVGSVSVIDPQMMSDYLSAARWTNTEENKVYSWSRNDAFTKVKNTMETDLTGEIATTDLNERLKDAS